MKESHRDSALFAMGSKRSTSKKGEEGVIGPKTGFK